MRRKTPENLIVACLLIVWITVGMQPFPCFAGDRIYGWVIAQKTVNTPQRDDTGGEAAGQPAPAKAQGGQGQEAKAADGAKVESPQPFEPSEKVKADQALDFPADI